MCLVTAAAPGDRQPARLLGLDPVPAARPIQLRGNSRRDFLSDPIVVALFLERPSGDSLPLSDRLHFTVHCVPLPRRCPEHAGTPLRRRTSYRGNTSNRTETRGMMAVPCPPPLSSHVFYRSCLFCVGLQLFPWFVPGYLSC